MAENLAPLLGTGIFAVDGDAWKHQRKVASRLFTRRTLRDSMATTIQSLLPNVHTLLRDAAATGEPLDLVALLNRFTIEAFAKIGFGIDLHGLDTAAASDHPFMTAFDRAQRLTTLRFVRPRFVWKLLNWLQLGSEAELTQHINVINDTVLSIITQALAQPPSGETTIVSLFVDDARRSGEQLELTALRDIVVNFLIAGRDTTAQALAWTFYELSRHPHVADRLRDEVGTVDAQRDLAPLSVGAVEFAACDV